TFRPGTEEGDYQVKLRNLMRFLSDGDKAKVPLRLRGREMAHQELGMELLKRDEADLAAYGTGEQPPKLEGRHLLLVIAPKKKKELPGHWQALQLFASTQATEYRTCQRCRPRVVPRGASSRPQTASSTSTLSRATS